MIFNEIYSAYYNAVAVLLNEMLSGERNESNLYEKARSVAFEESPMTVIPSLKNGKWQLVTEDFTPIIKNSPQMPLTNIQKRWLKTMLSDPKIQLFDLKAEWLDGVEPLFTPEDYCVYDKYSDGDDFTDEGYKKRFKTILFAIKNGKSLKLEIRNRNGVVINGICKPQKLEYSEKDDKFRLLTCGNHFISTVNLAKIESCEIYDGEIKLKDEAQKTDYGRLTLKITDERNALERCMLHFAHFEKRAEKTGENTYLLTVKYDRRDETEMVIRVLSFGSLVEVVSPPFFRKQIIKRLKSQMETGNF